LLHRPDREVQMKKMHVAMAALLSLSFVPVPSPADPPPWAPAHGWRKKNDPNYVGYTGKKWERDYGILEGTCNAAAVGAVLGGTVGGVVGSRVSNERDRPVAIIVGTVLGAVIGAKVGAKIDEGDRGCMGHALELAGEQKTVVWTNEATGVNYRLTPTRNFQEGKLPWRFLCFEHPHSWSLWHSQRHPSHAICQIRSSLPGLTNDLTRRGSGWVSAIRSSGAGLLRCAPACPPRWKRPVPCLVLGR